MESAWEGVNRRKTCVAKDPALPLASSGASAMTEDAAKDSEELDDAYRLEDEVSMELHG